MMNRKIHLYRQLYYSYLEDDVKTFTKYAYGNMHQQILSFNRMGNILRKNFMEHYWVEGAVFWKKLCHKQKAMLVALICKKLKILQFLIMMDTNIFNNIPFNAIILCESTRDSWYFINEYFPYKYNCKFCKIYGYTIISHRTILRCLGTHMEGHMSVLYYGKFEKSGCDGYDGHERYFKMTFIENTEEEIKELKWDNRKDFMLLGYGEQNNSLRSLPEDLIRSIAVCL